MRVPYGLLPRRVVLAAASLFIALALAGCAGLPARDPLHIGVVGLEPLPGQGLEMRFELRLRVQNPNETPVDYDGVAVDLEVNGRPFATGVSAQKGTLPRFGETVLAVPVSVPAMAALRQILGLAAGDRLDDLPYVLRGKLGGGPFGTRRFVEKGRIGLPQG